jgi:diacylglycerol kinase family enzyme
MNAEWLGNWDVAPRSHPGDGRFDIFEGSLGPQARYSVRARLRTGTHLPHPEIHTRKASETSIELPRTLRLRLDGAPFPRISAFSVWLEPGSLTVYV